MLRAAAKTRTETGSAGAREVTVLALIVALATIARAVKLDAPLWYDEVVTLVEYVRLPFGALVSTYESLNNHMFYSVLAKISVAVFGEQAWSLRLPALLFGVASIPVHWAIARRYVSAGEALLVAGLLAISYHHIWFSQNARGYTMLLFFTSFSVLMFLRGMEDGPRVLWMTWAGFALAAAGAIWTHLSALFFYTALGLVFAFVAGRALVRGRAGANGVPILAPIAAGVGALTIALLLNLPVLTSVASTIDRVSQATAASGQALAEWRSPLRAVLEVGRSLAALGPLVAPALAGAVLALAVGAVALARRAPLLVAIYLAQFPVTIAILSAFEMRIWPRYFFVEIGILILFAVHGALLIAGWAGDLIARRSRWGGAPTGLAAAAIFAMVLVSLALLSRNYAAPKQDFTAARDYVEARRAPGDQVRAIGLAGYVYDEYYRPGWHALEGPAELVALEQAPGRSWLIVAFPHQTERARPAMMRRVKRDYELAAKFPGTLGDGAVRVYRAR